MSALVALAILALAAAQEPVLTGDSLTISGEKNREKLFSPCPSSAEGKECLPRGASGVVGVIGPSSVNDRLTYPFEAGEEKYIDRAEVLSVREGSLMSMSKHASFSVKVCQDPDREESCCLLGSVVFSCEGFGEADCRAKFASEFRREVLQNRNNCKVVKGLNYLTVEPFTTKLGPSHVAFVQSLTLVLTNRTRDDIVQGSTTPRPPRTVVELLMSNAFLLGVGVVLILLTVAAVYLSMDALVSARQCSVCGNTTEEPDKCSACGRWMCPACRLEKDGASYCTQCGQQTFEAPDLSYEY